MKFSLEMGVELRNPTTNLAEKHPDQMESLQIGAPKIERCRYWVSRLSDLLTCDSADAGATQSGLYPSQAGGG